MVNNNSKETPSPPQNYPQQVIEKVSGVEGKGVDYRKIAIAVMLALILIIGIAYTVWYFTKPEEGRIVTSSLTEEETNMSVEELEQRYFSIENFTLEEVKDIVIKEIEEQGITELKVYEYDYDPTLEKNLNKIFQTIEEYEKTFISKFGHDTVYYEDMALSTNNPNFCLKIRYLYFKVKCVEEVYFFRALRKKDPSLCTDLGTNLIGASCKAFLEKNIAVCDGNEFENVFFKNNCCYAFATQNIDFCNDIDDCRQAYYVFRGVYYDDPSECDNIYDETEEQVLANKGEEAICKALVSRDSEYFKKEYLIGKLTREEKST